MKSTRLKISVSQDGLLPEESAEIATMQFPSLPKSLLLALGFERVDDNTFVGVVPVFVNLSSKGQEIEFELGVEVPEMRKQVIEMVKAPRGDQRGSGRAEPEDADTGNVIELKKKAAKKQSKKPAGGKKKGAVKDN